MNIKALTPRISYKNRLNIPIYPLLLTSSHSLPKKSQTLHYNKENEILPTIEWDSSSCVSSNSSTETSTKTYTETCTENIGFIILRHVNNSITNEYWKECYRCIKMFYPKNRILIIDDNSDYTYVTNDPLENTMIIRSEYPKRGEFLPYYYYLKTKFCETAVILHDSAFVKKYINFNVSNYKIILEFRGKCVADTESIQYQQILLTALNNTKLYNFYNKKDYSIWGGCFGSMSIVKYNYLKRIDSEYRIACLIPHITSRIARCAFERIIGCLLQININESSLLGSITTYCPWGLSFDEYLRHEYNKDLPLVKVWTGR
jgi:hypothetical protein